MLKIVILLLRNLIFENFETLMDLLRNSEQIIVIRETFGANQIHCDEFRIFRNYLITICNNFETLPRRLERLQP